MALFTLQGHPMTSDNADDAIEKFSFTAFPHPRDDQQSFKINHILKNKILEGINFNSGVLLFLSFFDVVTQ